VSARPESWSRPAEPGRAAFAGLLAAVLFLAAWGVIHYGFYARDQIVDTPLYERYGDAVVQGEVPYRDFGLEYPPGALPAFVLPSALAGVGNPDRFERTFALLMAACGALAAFLVALVLVADGAGPVRLVAGIGLVALAPLALGSVVLSRFDLWPALLTVVGVAAVAFGRSRLGLGVLGLAIAAKVYPAALLPVAVTYVWKVSGRRTALQALGICVAVALLIVVPFLALAPGGVWDSIVRQTTRPLQIESLGASFVLAAHQLAGTGLTISTSHGSQNLTGPAAAALGAVQSALLIVVLVAIWIWFAHGPAERARFLRASAAAVCAFVALGKVLSPQFLIWLVPLVPLVRGRRGLAASALLLAALVLTQVWFPYRYWSLALDLDPAVSWLVLARDLILLGLLAVLLWPARSPPLSRRSA
jgi:uncharacterized membrane protein